MLSDIVHMIAEKAHAVLYDADFIRVGSLKRIDKRLLPYSLHARQNSGKGDAVSELTDMLKASTSPGEQALLQKELAEV